MPANILGPKSNSFKGAMGSLGKIAFGGNVVVKTLKLWVGVAVAIGVVSAIFPPKVEQIIPPKESPVKIAEPELNCDASARCTLAIKGLEGANFLKYSPSVEIEEGCGAEFEKESVESALAYHYFFSINPSKITKKACDMKVAVDDITFHYADALSVSAE